jgi:hypothetical protein
MPEPTSPSNETTPHKKLAYGYHEASHAVVWMLNGYKIVSVDLTESSECIGAFTKRNFGCTTPGDYVGPCEINSEGHARTYISGVLAAGIGEKQFTGRDSDGLNKDYELVNQCIANVDPEKARKLVAEIITELNTLLKEQDVWNAVRELALLLQERNAVGDDVYAIILKNCSTKLLTPLVGKS